MYCASEVDELFQQWKQQGFTKEQLITKVAVAELGWPYVWGAVGAPCSPDKRDYYAKRPSCPAGEVKQIYKTCQCYNEDGTRTGKSCGGCQFYPNNMRTLCDDCQGFAKQVMSRVGVSLSGGGCTSMWNNDSNWIKKGYKAEMPNQVCLVFCWSKKNQNMSHVGLHIGDGVIVECSGTVRYNNVSKSIWTHYAIPKGLGGDTPMPWRPTIRKGSTGDDVVYCQQILMKLGYDLGSYGADGRFGAKTQQAVVAFQKSKSLNPDGVVGPLTWDALENAVKPGEKLYTVCIQHLDKTQADAMKRNYPQAVVTEE